MSIQAVAVVIPARNEEALIGRCLASVQRAATGLDPGIAVTVTVVADDCDDATEVIARDSGTAVHIIARRNVGAARAAGIAEALRRHPVRADRLWIANTDADTVVPANWLTGQVLLANAGWDVVVGTVRPDFDELSERQVAAWQATHDPAVANGHVHGANLGVRASRYERAGGFTALSLHEDNDLVARLVAQHARIAATAALEVVTSGRQYGRAPGGYAQYLREELVL